MESLPVVFGGTALGRGAQPDQQRFYEGDGDGQQGAAFGMSRKRPAFHPMCRLAKVEGGVARLVGCH